MIQTALEPGDVLYRDGELLGINKPVGVPVHGSRIFEDAPETLLAMVRKLEGRLSHVIHRLDRPVSGAMLFTGNRELLSELGQSFESRTVRKRYLAVTRGWTKPCGVISHPLLPPKDERKASSVAREAVTRYERIARVELPFPVHPYATSRYCLLGLYPETGRRHQLRRHMKHISHHLVGDTTYGRGEHNRLFREKLGCQRLLLHAWSLELRHPKDNRQVRIQAPLDSAFTRVIKTFEWEAALETWSGKPGAASRP